MTQPIRTRTFDWQDPMLTASGVNGKTGLQFLQAMIAGEIPVPPIMQTLAYELTAVDQGFARFECDPAEFHYNPIGVVHGGLACTLLDSAMGCAVMTTLDEKSAYTTAQLNVNLTRAITAATGRVVAESRIIQRGARIAVAEGKLIDAKGTLFAHSTTTCMIMPRPG
jgi:uncharacterized protein (TIGR00369 family)